MEHPSGWFPDPLERYDHRWFNGRAWTSDVSNDGRRLVDPMGTVPSPQRTGDTGNGAATAAVVMGSVGLAIAWIPFVVVAGVVLAVLAVVFGVRGLGRSRTTGTGRGAAVAGTVMGALGIAASVVGAVLSVVVWRAVVDFVEPGRYELADVRCEVDGRRVDVSGTVTNREDDVRTYTVFVDVRDEVAVATVTDVAPGASERWTTALTTPSVLDDCEPATTVQGPFPFGIELDPIDDPVAGAIAASGP